MNLGNFKISAKIFAIVGALGIVSAVIAATGISAMSTLNDATTEMEVAGSEALLGSRINTNVISLNRAEYNIAANPSPAAIAEARKYIEEQQTQLEERLAKLKETAGPNQTVLLQKIDGIYENYKEELAETLSVAERNSATVQITSAQQEVLTSVEGSREVASELRDAVREYFLYAEQKSVDFSAQAEALYKNQSIVMVSVAVGGLLLGLALGWVVSQRGIVVPMRRIVECLQTLAGGNLEITVFGTERKDEVGDIGKTTQVFKENMIRNRELEAEQAKERAAREVRAQAVEKLTGDFDKAVSATLKTVASAATELQATAGSMSATAEETNRQASAVAAASEQASTNVQTVASAAEELSASISEITRQVAQSASIAGKAVADADRTNAQVQGLAEAAQKIGDVVRLINDIASQTNLLALNATIEAARAGEAGKGFAVVAAEVKNLANETAKATDEITAQIAGVQGATKEAVSAIQSIGQTIGQINEIATTIASAVEEQGAATQEIARNVQQASAGTTEVSSNISGVTQAATETGAAANQVLSASGELSRESESLRSQVERFLTGVRAA